MYNLNTVCNLGITIALLLSMIGKYGQVRERETFSGKKMIRLFHTHHWCFFLYSEVRELLLWFITFSCSDIGHMTLCLPSCSSPWTSGWLAVYSAPSPEPEGGAAVVGALPSANHGWNTLWLNHLFHMPSHLLHPLILIFYFYFFAMLGLHCCAWTFSCCGKSGLLLSWGAQASACDDFSCCEAQALGLMGFSRCSTWAQ